MAAVVAVAFIGFFIGISRERRPVSHPEPAPRETASGAPLARSNEALVTRPWRTELTAWEPEPPPDRPPVTNKDRAAYQRALAARAERRAFDGAPPTIPHPVSQGSARECMVCHERGGVINGVIAPPMSHELHVVCTQCHVPEVPGIGPTEPRSPAALAVTDFAGAREPPAPLRWSPASPPQTPHRTFMRERCASCHGPAGRPGLQTSHPERQVCQQCHAASAVVDQRPGSRP